MSDQLAHNLNTSMNMSTTSINGVEAVNTPCPSIFDNNIMDDGLASCSLVRNIEESVDNDDYSLHDIFQHLSQVPLHATTATLAPTPTPTPMATPPGTRHHRLEEGHSCVVARDYQTVGQKFKEIDVDVVKGHSKRKQPLEPEQADNQQGSSRRNAQRRNSEHKRRERINAKMRTIRALVPTCDKDDHASILDHAIKYIKFLKRQIDIMSRSIGQSQLQSLYAPQMMAMHPTMVPRIEYGPWQSQMPPSGYPFMVTPSGDGGVPIQPIPQVQAQAKAKAQAPFSPILCPLQYLPTSITQPPTPTVMSYVPPLPQFTPPNPSDEPTHFQPPNF